MEAMKKMEAPNEVLRLWCGPFHDEALYLETGRRYVEYLINNFHLKDSDAILDIGCGCGNTAMWLTQHLSASARFEGFDVAAEPIEWCRNHISRSHSQFQFGVADIFNRSYNPRGAVKASRYRFPYESETFDIVLARSVFTHLVPRDMENYLAEAARVLKIGGRCIFSFFLMNDRSRQLVKAGKSSIAFVHQKGPYFVVDRARQESAVAYDEDYVLKCASQLGLAVTRPIEYGLWSSGTSLFHEYQDFVEFTKARPFVPRDDTIVQRLYKMLGF